jgi:hypothetical protein
MSVSLPCVVLAGPSRVPAGQGDDPDTVRREASKLIENRCDAIWANGRRAFAWIVLLVASGGVGFLLFVLGDEANIGFLEESLKVSSVSDGSVCLTILCMSAKAEQ